MTTSTPNDFAYLCIWAFDYECRPNQQRVVAIHPTGFLLAGDSQPDYISYFCSHFLQKVRFDVNNGGDVTTNLSKKRRWRHFGDTVSYGRSQLIIDRKGSDFLRNMNFFVVLNTSSRKSGCPLKGFAKVLHHFYDGVIRILPHFCWG